MTLEERKIEFIAEVHTSALNKYSDEMLQDFIGYWCELDRKNKKKMRFEGEKYFSMGRRLARWAKNEKQWNTPKILNTKVEQVEFLKERYGYN